MSSPANLLRKKAHRVRWAAAPTHAGLIISFNVRVARLLTTIIVPLAFIASAGGLLIHNLYRDAPEVIPAMRGQDLVTLISCPILAAVLLASESAPRRHVGEAQL